MPLEDEIIGRNKDGTLNEEYCKWCYADGTYTYSDMDDLIEICIPHMASEGFTEEQTRDYMKQLLPTLNYWKKYEKLTDNGEFEELKKQLIEEINNLNIEGKVIIQCAVHSHSIYNRWFVCLKIIIMSATENSYSV